MPSEWSAETIIESCRTRGALPTTAETFDTEAMLSLMTEECRVYMQSVLRGTPHIYRDEYQDFELDGDTYLELPALCSYAGLRRVAYMQGDQELWLVETDERKIMNFLPSAGQPTNWYFRQNRIYFFPGAVSGTVRLYYMPRHPKLIIENQASVIDSFTSTTLTIGNTAFANGNNTFDIVEATPHFNVKARGIIGNVSPSTTVTFSAGDLPDDLVVGDWLVRSGESPIPLMPAELFPLLSQRLLVVVLAALGRTDRAGVAQARLEEMYREIMVSLSPRAEDTDEVLINPFGPGNANLPYPGWPWGTT